MKFKKSSGGYWIPIEDVRETPYAKSDFYGMTDGQLSEYAVATGVDISRCKTREGIIGKLEKAGQRTG